MLEIVPMTLREANAFVEQNHRHHGKVAGHKFSIDLRMVRRSWASPLWAVLLPDTWTTGGRWKSTGFARMGAVSLALCCTLPHGEQPRYGLQADSDLHIRKRERDKPARRRVEMCGTNLTKKSMRGWMYHGGSPKEDLEDNLDVLRQRSRDAYMGIPTASPSLITLE